MVDLISFRRCYILYWLLPAVNAEELQPKLRLSIIIIIIIIVIITRPSLGLAIAAALQRLRWDSLVILGEIGPHGQCGGSLAVTARLEL